MRRSERLGLTAMAAVAAALLLAACDETHSSMDVEVEPPEVASSGPVLSEEEWRQRVSEICRAASRRVGAASAVLTAELSNGGGFTEAEVSRGVYELGRPVIEKHLEQLAGLRPPSSKVADYQRFIAALAEELELSGRIAELLAAGEAHTELVEADAGLGAAAATASKIARREKLSGCAGVPPAG